MRLLKQAGNEISFGLGHWAFFDTSNQLNGIGNRVSLGLNRPHSREHRDTFPAATAVVVLVAMLKYSCFGLEIVTSKEKHRPAAMSVNEIVPKGETLYIFKPGNQLNPVIFYISTPISYVLEANDIDEKLHYLLIKKADLEAFESEGGISVRSAEVLYKFTDRISGNYRLVHLK